MGYDTGLDPDSSGTFAICLFYEYPAKCKFDKNWISGTGFYDGRNYFECIILFVFEAKRLNSYAKR